MLWMAVTGEIKRLRLEKVRCVLMLGLVVAGVLAGGVRAESLSEVEHFGPNPGNLRMFAYVPDGLEAGRPLVVALHGCLQRATDFDDETGWVELAERWRFALLLPQQQLRNNQLRCFNWFNGRHRIFDWLLWLTDRGNDIDRGGSALRQIHDRADACRSFARCGPGIRHRCFRGWFPDRGDVGHLSGSLRRGRRARRRAL